jgi:Na+-driven multidrug efflux pump
MDPRTRALLEAPISTTLLRLAAPNMLVMVAQAQPALIEIHLVGKLCTDALAGVALVFPVVMLMQILGSRDRSCPSAMPPAPACRPPSSNAARRAD